MTTILAGAIPALLLIGVPVSVSVFIGSVTGPTTDDEEISR